MSLRRVTLLRTLKSDLAIPSLLDSLGSVAYGLVLYFACLAAG